MDNVQLVRLPDNVSTHPSRVLKHTQITGQLKLSSSKKRKYKQQFVMAAINVALDTAIHTNWHLVALDVRQLKRAKRAAIHNAQKAAIVFTV